MRKGRLVNYTLEYSKHKALLGDSGKGSGSYFEKRSRLFVKVMKQVTGQEQGGCV